MGSRLVPCLIAVVLAAQTASADRLLLESLAEGDLRTQYEGVSWTASGVGFAAIRFSLSETTTITRTSANLIALPLGSSDRFFMGIEALDGPTDVPDYTVAAGPGSLLAYGEASAGTVPLSEVFFPIGVELDAGLYALVVGCAAFDCYGGLHTGAPGTTPPIPLDDFLLSYGSTTSQNWNYTSPSFRVALYEVPEPSAGAALALGLVGLGLRSAGRRQGGA